MSRAPGNLRELFRSESLEAAPEQPSPATGGPRPTFFGHLLQPELLPPAALETAPVRTRGPAFLQTLLAREQLPVGEPPPAAQSEQGFLGWILARETLPRRAAEDSATRARSILGRLLEPEQLPHDPAPSDLLKPSFLRGLLSSESLEERGHPPAD